MPYIITASAWSSFEEQCGLLAIGLKDGAIVVLDLILGFEKHFLEKHPTSVSALSFFEDKTVVSGSICGQVHLSDLHSSSLFKA